MVSGPSAISGAEIARSSTPLAPPATVDQKIELVTRWPAAPPPVRICRVGFDGPPPVVVDVVEEAKAVRVTLSVGRDLGHGR